MAETEQRLPERRLRVVASAPAEIRAELFAHAPELPTRELHAIRRELEAEITKRRPPAPTPAPATAAAAAAAAAQDVIALNPDDRIDVALAEHLPWPDGSIDLCITSPPYCLGEAVPYEPSFTQRVEWAVRPVPGRSAPNWHCEAARFGSRTSTRRRT